LGDAVDSSIVGATIGGDFALIVFDVCRGGPSQPVLVDKQATAPGTPFEDVRS
jgi:hypothetical protein